MMAPMKRIAAFLKATTLGGLFVLLPVVMLFVMIAKVVVTMRSAAQAVLGALSGQGSVVAELPMLYAGLIVIAISFVLGLMMISQLGRSVGNWIERTLLFRIPGYTALRAIVGGLASAECEGVVKPGLMKTGEGAEAFVFITEDHGDGKLTVFLPGTPNPGSGTVLIVPKDHVRTLHVRITGITQALQQWGVGSAKLLARHESYWDGKVQTEESAP